MSDPRETGRIEAVLFDLHNTTLDGSYAGVGLEHVTRVIADRWNVTPTHVPRRFFTAVKQVMPRYLDRDFYLMRDVFVDAFRILADELGIDADRDDLLELDAEMWRASIPAARPMPDAIETFDAIRATGRKVGVVSFADAHVFDALIARLDFADHVDIALCSEVARSCKPDPGIFRIALHAVGVEPARAMLVGDTVDSDVVGGNRVGMITVLVEAGEFTNDAGAFGDDPLTVPDHRIDSLLELDRVLGAYS